MSDTLMCSHPFKDQFNEVGIHMYSYYLNYCKGYIFLANFDI